MRASFIFKTVESLILSWKKKNQKQICENNIVFIIVKKFPKFSKKPPNAIHTTTTNSDSLYNR